MRSEAKLEKLKAKLKKANEQTIEYAQSAEEAEKKVAEVVEEREEQPAPPPHVIDPKQGDNELRTAFSSKPNQIHEDSYQHIFTQQSSSVARTLQLIPGIYFMFADISYDIPVSDLIKKTLNIAHPHERPWLEHRDASANELILHISSHCRFLASKVSNPEKVPRNTVDLSVVPDAQSRNHFVCESQSEAASRGLVNMLSDIKVLLEKEESKLVVIKSQVEEVSKAISDMVAPKDK